MKIVIDTNILFSYFNENSFTKKLIESPFFELVSPEFSIIELEKYSETICKKTKLSSQEFKRKLSELKEVVKFIPLKEYGAFLPQAKEISPDIKDADFFALSLNLSTFLWSNDKLLKSQNNVIVFSTEEIINNFLE